MYSRGKIRLICYGAAVLIVLVTALAACHVGAGGYTASMDAQSTRAFGEAYHAIARLDQSLKKSAFAVGDSMQSTLCAEIYSNAQSANTALSTLPIELDALEELSKQLSVIGDYAYALFSASVDHDSLDPELISRFSDFSETTTELQRQLEILQQAYEDGTLVHEARLRLTDSLNNLEEETKEKTESLNTAFHRLKDGILPMESISYDGQFSESEDSGYLSLEGKAEVTQEDAKRAAAQFLDCDVSQLKAIDPLEGELPCWRFSVPESDGVISVTKQGGEVLRYLIARSAQSEPDRETAVSAAAVFLEQHGFDQMIPDPFESESDDALRFAACYDDVICLPDRISIRVDANSGALLAYDASGYLKHHHERQMPAMDPETLRSAIPENASMEDAKSVILLSPGGQELLCAAFRCTLPELGTASVFVNAETGKQVRILLPDEALLSGR